LKKTYEKEFKKIKKREKRSGIVEPGIQANPSDPFYYGPRAWAFIFFISLRAGDLFFKKKKKPNDVSSNFA
jgi:choline-glycine betaine transporter